MISLAVIGFEPARTPGYFQALKSLPEVQLVAVAEADRSCLQASLFDMEGTALFTDHRDLLAQTKVDGVIIGASSTRHHSIVVDCARAGKAVLCEEPIAADTEEAQEILAVCQASDVPLGMCFPMRLSPAVRQARRSLEEGLAGEIVAVKAVRSRTLPGSRRGDSVEAGGGAVMNLTGSVIDILRWMLQAEFTRVFCHTARRRQSSRVDDLGLLSLEMSNGAFVTVDTGWSGPEKPSTLADKTSLTVVGSRGILNLDLSPQGLRFFSEEQGTQVVITKERVACRDLLENFVDTIGGKTSLVAEGIDGLRSLEVVEAAYKSAASGSVVVL